MGIVAGQVVVGVQGVFDVLIHRAFAALAPRANLQRKTRERLRPRYWFTARQPIEQRGLRDQSERQYRRSGPMAHALVRAAFTPSRKRAQWNAAAALFVRHGDATASCARV
jgi:hypothetical protein